MPCFSNLHYPSKGNNPTRESIQTIRRTPEDCAKSFPVLCRLLALLLALAVAPMVVLAEEGGNVHDLTGAWFVTNTFTGSSTPFFALDTFTKEGNFIGVTPSLVNNPATPGVGVWIKTGARTFALTFRSIESDVNANTTGFLKVRQTLVLNQSGDQWDGTAVLVETDPNGNVLTTLQVTMHAVRIVVEPL